MLANTGEQVCWINTKPKTNLALGVFYPCQQRCQPTKMFTYFCCWLTKNLVGIMNANLLCEIVEQYVRGYFRKLKIRLLVNKIQLRTFWTCKKSLCSCPKLSKLSKLSKLAKLAKYASNSDWERKWAPGRGDGEVISVSVPNRLRQQRGCYATLALDIVDIDIYLIV